MHYMTWIAMGATALTAIICLALLSEWRPSSGIERWADFIEDDPDHSSKDL